MDDFGDYDALSFDCYGTLIDWEAGISAALQPWARRHGLDLDSEALIAAHGRHETHVQQEKPNRPYPEVLAETLHRIAADYRVDATNEEGSAYGVSVGKWPPFPDSAPALAALRERYRLIILSNVDRRSFAESNRQLGVDFDLVVTAEDVGAYKPDPRSFRHLLDRLRHAGIDPARTVHVAESLYHDHEPAQAAGMETVWIHRRHSKIGFGATAPPVGRVQPTWCFESIEEFAATALSR